jgi:tripartite-type tricarboxylate transporter receptor subunit TctC
MTMLKGSRAVIVALVAFVAGLAPGPVAAQEKYPNRPVDFIVTWGTGGGADAMARRRY